MNKNITEMKLIIKLFIKCLLFNILFFYSLLKIPISQLIHNHNYAIKNNLHKKNPK